MTEPSREEVQRRVSEIATRIRESENPEEWRDLCSDVAPLMTAYWDVHPHSAMEMLEALALDLPLSLAHPLVRNVVLAWRAKSTYDPDAGGNANHCYLSALILSENYDLAEHPWAERVLPYTIDKEVNYERRMRDRDRKRALVESLRGGTS
jgi:hypothetical protein